jgi:hypothetical protein
MGKRKADLFGFHCSLFLSSLTWISLPCNPLGFYILLMPLILKWHSVDKYGILMITITSYTSVFQKYRKLKLHNYDIVWLQGNKLCIKIQTNTIKRRIIYMDATMIIILWSKLLYAYKISRIYERYCNLCSFTLARCFTTFSTVENVSQVNF